jgi:hypothetical protein
MATIELRRSVGASPSQIDWAAIGGVTADIALPVLSILVPTLIAVFLFRAERRDARAADARSRRMDASADVIRALAPMASIQPDDPMQERLWELRARIAVYRTWIERDDLSGDWLALRHREGMMLWAGLMGILDSGGGPKAMPTAAVADILSPAHRWAAQTLEMLSAWIRGDLEVDQLRGDGARIIEQYGPPLS